jgi:hypothetical protein
MLQHAIAMLTRRRFPGTGEEVSRWTVRCAPLPAGTDAWVLLNVEELAVNDLRETFHHWVRTLVFPVIHGTLGTPLPHLSALAPARRQSPHSTKPTTTPPAHSSKRSNPTSRHRSAAMLRS